MTTRLSGMSPELVVEHEDLSDVVWLPPIDGCPIVTYKNSDSIAIYSGWHTPDLLEATHKTVTERSTKLKAEHLDEEAYLFYQAVAPSVYILEETPVQKANYKWFNGHLRKVRRNQYRQKLRQRRHYIHSQLGYKDGRHLRTTQDFYPAPDFYDINVDLNGCTCCTKSCSTCDYQYPLSDWESENDYTSDKEVLERGFITESSPIAGQKSAHTLLERE